MCHSRHRELPIIVYWEVETQNVKTGYQFGIVKTGPKQCSIGRREGLGLGLAVADKRLDDASTSEGNASPRPRKGMPRPRLGQIDRCLGLASDLNASASA